MLCRLNLRTIASISLLLVLLNLVDQQKSIPSISPFVSSDLPPVKENGVMGTVGDDLSSDVLNTPDSSLRNIHIVMVGDSIMRYQYLSLAFRLRHGVWFQNSMWNYDLVNEQSFKNPFHDISHNEFLFQTNNILQPLEVCDCLTGRRERDRVENRFFYDPIFNNSLVYLSALGHKRPLKGRLHPHQVQNLGKSWRVDSLQNSKEIVWQYNWEDVISTFIRSLDPPPKHVVMNAGLSGHNFGKTEEQKNESNKPWSRDTRNLLKATGDSPEVNVVWKTTTFGIHGQKPNFERDDVMCTLLPNCFNVSFTKHVRPDLYWDPYHFKEPVHRAMNEQMLDLLGYLPKKYKRLDLSIVTHLSNDETVVAKQSSILEEHRVPSVFSSKQPNTVQLLRNIHIVMIGDSLMRYQYLSLAFRLRHGVWFDEHLWHYNLVNYRSFANPFHGRLWNEFLFQSSHMLYPYELCDCFRQPDEVVENRYYYDPILNNSLVFLTAFGHSNNTMKGRILPHHIAHERSNRSDYFKREAFLNLGHLVWNYSDWADTILSYIRFLHPQPKHIVLNAGLWPHSFCSSKPHSNTSSALLENETEPLSPHTRSLLRALEMTPEIHFAWRTTTFIKEGRQSGFECDDLMCNLLPTCINVSFTRRAERRYYVDQTHFSEPIYRIFNEEMLNELGYLPKSFVRINSSSIMYS